MMDFFSKFLTPLFKEQKAVVLAVLCQWPVMASMLFLGSTEYRLFEYWEQLVLSLAAVIWVTFISFLFSTACFFWHHIKDASPSCYLLSLPTLVASVFQIACCDTFTLPSFKLTFIWTVMTIYTTVFILGFGYRKETDSQNKNNDTINTDTDKEKA
ncbi:hypothetical protein L4X50_19320 [Phocaeicola vulgatus]|jgi:hypothetical protein|uniref:hypothetical protein n=1 Tax=Phocaeicola vulgatus TaxID=821 RepID=UPI001F454162|nr:hypothetical protein [Phocaeicola vulgatus]MCG0204355.1 hypothetical protein [Phocaeicola vulgatus]MCG0270319.1 hypothetical protein [Phocaeicola vulgatus]MCG0350207.1 hypothetical protein [Phocaeicola vulgatus]UWG88555.1 MAG: hypothetical protein [Bacteriophage sp.]